MSIETPLAVVILIARVSEALGKHLTNANLSLEANPVARYVGWPVVWGSIVLCVVPYVHVGAGIATAVLTLLGAGRTFSGIWFARSLGEREVRRIHDEAVARAPAWVKVLSIGAQFVFSSFVGVVLLAVTKDRMARWFAAGLMLYSLAAALFGALSVFRVFESKQNRV